MTSDPRDPRLFVFGAGGSGREVAWLARTISPDVDLVFGVDRLEYMSDEVDGYPVVLLTPGGPQLKGAFVAAVGDPTARRHAVDVCSLLGLVPTVLAHPGVDLTGRVSIGEGTVVCLGAILTTGIEIGRHVQINIGVSISHDVVVGDFSTLSPGARVSGNVRVGEGALIGAGATIINGRPGDPLIIGDGAVVAAGACVTRPVEAGAVVAGVPATRKR